MYLACQPLYVCACVLACSLHAICSLTYCCCLQFVAFALCQLILTVVVLVELGKSVPWHVNGKGAISNHSEKEMKPYWVCMLVGSLWMLLCSVSQSHFSGCVSIACHKTHTVVHAHTHCNSQIQRILEDFIMALKEWSTLYSMQHDTRVPMHTLGMYEVSTGNIARCNKACTCSR